MHSTLFLKFVSPLRNSGLIQKTCKKVDSPGQVIPTLVNERLNNSYCIAHFVWSILETFVNMDVALLTELSADQLLEAFMAENWGSAVDPPGNLSHRESLVMYSCLRLSSPPI